MSVSRKKKSALSRLIAWLHLWLGIGSGLILIFVCLTGTIIVFGDEIINLSAGKARYVNTIGQQRLPASVLIDNVKKALPEEKVSYFIYYKDPSRTVRVLTFSRKTGLINSFVDPYTGAVVKTDNTIQFFYVTAHLHAMLLSGKTGKWIVDIATIIFLIELISGIVLWWPPKWTKALRDRSFKIKWKASFKRVNYDLHNVVGFYSCAFALLLTVTGLIIAFAPLQDATVRLFGGDPSHKWEKGLPAFRPEQQPASYDSAFARQFARHPEATAVRAVIYRVDSSGWYGISTAQQVNLKTTIGHVAFIDRYTGEEIPVPKSAIIHEDVENAVMYLHVGAYMGLWGKTFTFIIGIICTSLPITGFYIWWGRRNKKKKPVKQPAPEYSNAY